MSITTNKLFEEQLKKLTDRVKMAGLVYTSDKPKAVELLSKAYENLLRCRFILAIQPPSEEAMKWANNTAAKMESVRLVEGAVLKTVG